MPIHIDEVSSDVQVEGERPAAAAAPQPPGQALARWRDMQQRLLRDESRTSACGNED